YAFIGNNSGRTEALVKNVHQDSLASKVKNLQKEILAIDSTAPNAQALAANAIDQFAQKNLKNLIDFESDIKLLKKHIESNYVSKATPNLFRSKTSKGVPTSITYAFFSKEYGKHGLSEDQAERLV